MLLFEVFQYTGLIAFAISGALLGVKKGLDFFGVIMLAVTTALGGGVIRDVIIGNTPPVSFKEPRYFIISLITAVAVFMFYVLFDKMTNLILVFDAIGLGVFTSVGAEVALQNGIDAPFILVCLGVLTGIGGGIFRDVFVKEIPYVFRKEVYAVASILGGITFVITRYFIAGSVPLYTCAFVTIAIRLIAIYFNIDLPRAKTGQDKSGEISA